MGPIAIILLTFLIISAAGLYAICARDLSAARARLISRSKTMNTSFGTVEYAVLGEGEPVLIIHGAGGGFDQGIDMSAPLAELGYRLIVPSRFGYLASTLPPNPTTAMQADAYAELLDNLRLDKAFVLAISAGEWSALQFAVRHPERCRAMVLIVPANYLPGNMSNYGGPMAKLIFGSDLFAWATSKLNQLMPGAMSEMVLGTKSSIVLAAEPKEKAQVMQILNHLLPVSARFGGMQFDLRTAATPEPYPIERIGCPVLTISAEDDLFGTSARAKYVAAHAPAGRAVIFPTGGHALVGRQAEVLHEITSFLQGVHTQEHQM